MNRTAYIAISYSKRNELAEELSVIKEALVASGIHPFVFAEKFQFDPSQDKEMEHSTTLSGISDQQVIYENRIDLKEKLQMILNQVMNP